jgi:GNAT superfamily N-acetyltransferase
MASKLAKFTSIVLSLTLTISPGTSSPAPSNHHYLSVANANFTLRQATSRDIPSISRTVLDAFDPGVINTYMYQFRDLYPEFHMRCYEEEIERRWVKSIDADRREWWNGIVPQGEQGVRSFALWALMRREEIDSPASSFDATGFWPDVDDLGSLVNIPFQPLQQITQSPLTLESEQILAYTARLPDLKAPCRLHLDMNIIRALHLLRQLRAADAKYIKNAFETQLYLGVLATHPEWDGNGFGAAQLHWGKDLAKRIESREREEGMEDAKVPITLLATPAGYPLYKSMGFKSIANITLDLLDGVNDGSSWYEYMVWYGQE